MQAKDFSGGERSVARLLQGLGFVVQRDEADVSALVPGVIYSRSDLHDRFGGQEQGGITTPKSVPVILAFTGFSGAQHGYTDGWLEKVFCYYGEGQTGNMMFTKGNLAIRDHAKNGKDILVFEMLRKPKGHVKFLGIFACGSLEYRPTPDSTKTLRQAIVFHLVPLTTQMEDELSSQSDLSELRRRAEAEGSQTPERKALNALSSYIFRAATVRDYALARAAGKCERCSKSAPFHTVAGKPFLEVHHIRRLSDGGPDRHDAVAAICPNCHREAHHGKDQVKTNSDLLEAVHAKEVVLGRTTA